MTREELAQRTSCLLSRAIEGAGVTPRELAERAEFIAEQQVQRFRRGALLPRIDVLSKLLETCGYELTIGMRRIEPDEPDDS